VARAASAAAYILRQKFSHAPAGLIQMTPQCSDVSALMLSICETLGSAAFYSLAASTDRLRVVPAFFGADDAMETRVSEGS
jgi:hypothetical protein